MTKVETTVGALERLSSIARVAGDAILGHRPTDVARSHKTDGSPVSAADVVAQQAIVAALTRWDPAIPIVAEEADAPPSAVRSGWAHWWLVDPLDGTKEFLANNGEFTVNIALIECGTPVLGVVFAPALDLMYCAGRGLGAWRQSGAARPERITSRRWCAGRPARIVESRSHPSAALETFLRSIQVSERIRLGSSLKFCRVADGTADLYPRFGRMMEWDVAAGDCIYRNSVATGERFSPIQYNTIDLSVPGFVLGHDDFAAVTAVARTA